MQVGANRGSGFREERSHMEELEQQVAATQIDFVQYAKDRLSFEKSYDMQKTQASQLNAMYCKAVMALCAVPLRKGVKPASVLKSIGMCVGCCLLSKTFREEVSTTVRKALYPVVCKRAEKFGPDSVWSKRKAQMEASENGGYLPLTPDSAAVMKVAFCEQAYERMRQPGANVQEIIQQYTDAESALYRHAAKDGISAKVLDQSMRTLVGHMIERDPSAAKYFTETAYDVVKRGPSKQHRVRMQTDQGVQESVYDRWEGGYENADGTSFEHGFHPRLPETVNHIRKMQCDVWYQAMKTANTPEEWADVICSEEVLQKQMRYMSMMREDNRINADQPLDVSTFMKDADTSWMTDYGGPDPFHAPGFDLDYEAFMKTGPGQEDESVPGRFPELKSAFGKWLVEHTEYNPAYWQRQANGFYAAYRQSEFQDDFNLEEIRACLDRRDQCVKQWGTVFDTMNQKFGFQHSGGKSNSSHKDTFRDVPNMESDDRIWEHEFA